MSRHILRNLHYSPLTMNIKRQVYDFGNGITSK